jgi:hypothetical protein
MSWQLAKTLHGLCQLRTANCKPGHLAKKNFPQKSTDLDSSL